MTATLHQFPQVSMMPIHCIRQGQAWYVYRVQFEFEGIVELFHIWARSNDDAQNRVQAIMSGAVLEGRLKDILENDT